MTDSNPNASLTAPSIHGDALPPVEQHAQQYATVRNAHETELIEDYVELIGDLLTHRGEARAADIANRMAVSQATVSKMIRRLNELELVTSKPYRSLFLTEAGQKMAETSRARHDIVLHFLRALGVKDATARIDAEGMEHHVSDETLDIMQRFTEQQQKS
ncbi:MULTISPECIES: manganese-binding transcriptional regulator MntR [Halomonadaceae]|uniref:Transcriptional regulator MntR n=1 Tax=Vreelandella maris TaxID=2729617 RepID=A0A7Y6RCX3_9GAMM|nr:MULTISPECIES: manganese-binding transcriptional regulator MntR [Halomonas]EHA17201.1 transcriptional regulator mntR [Halomonas sp. HAL1]NVF14613.1 manganese-binding transcriptional regulator MntR [Halomonas maris]PKG48934.1 transcriptional regulator MntR [Halomonas sp. MES3-P3E]WKV94662.1 manganese-binding transcriptional regulator MntR [Halomonas sp. HAL1]|tara:strand:+ start:979 stop:1458 length:480 start_codon:yes stop_codon:yes gene_type:complete